MSICRGGIQPGLDLSPLPSENYRFPTRCYHSLS